MSKRDIERLVQPNTLGKELTEALGMPYPQEYQVTPLDDQELQEAARRRREWIALIGGPEEREYIERRRQAKRNAIWAMALSSVCTVTTIAGVALGSVAWVGVAAIAFVALALIVVAEMQRD